MRNTTSWSLAGSPPSYHGRKGTQAWQCHLVNLGTTQVHELLEYLSRSLGRKGSLCSQTTSVTPSQVPRL